MRTEEEGYHELSAARLKTSNCHTQPTCESSSSHGHGRKKKEECDRKLSEEPGRLEVERETLATNLLYSYWQSIHEFAPISSCTNQSAELFGAKELLHKQNLKFSTQCLTTS